MIPIAKPLLGAEEKRAVLDVLESGMLAQGKKVEEFEKAFASYLGVRHAIATSNGTTALHAALLANGIGLEDEVITTPFSFIATANAIKMAGATPVFVDIEEQTLNIDPDKIEAAITPKTKAILPVHLFGLPANMAAITAIAKKHTLKVIEDACQAHGATVQGKHTGSFGTGCFSFYATKNMITGEGGMITTDDAAIAAKLRKIISHGSERRYYHEMLGYNYRMTDIAAAIGIEQLKKLPTFIEKRRKNAAFLTTALAPLFTAPSLSEGHVFHQYTLRVKNREKVMDHLAKEGVGCSIFYPIPIHQQQSYKEYHHLCFPIAEQAAREVLSIPVHPALTEDDLQKIAAVLRDTILKDIVLGERA